MMDDRGQAIILFSLIVIAIITSIAYYHAQDIASGVESTRAMLSYPKEEIHNIREIWIEVRSNSTLKAYMPEVDEQFEKLCATKGWLCNLQFGKFEFKSVEVSYCEGSC